MMHIANHDDPDPAAGTPARAGQGRAVIGARPQLALVEDALVLAQPAEAPDAAWRAAMMQLADWLNLGLVTGQERPDGRRRRAAWRWSGSGMAAPPLFAPWLSHASTAFQDPRAARDLFPAQWVASYLWDPCGSRPVTGGPIDVMLVSPHPAACRADAESCATLPATGLLQDMIGAAHTEGRHRIAIIGHERSRNVTARQLLAARPMLPDASLAFEVLAIEEALPRLAGHPGSWDAIIVLPELRGMVFALLTRLCGIEGPLPMVWHRQGLSLLCGETAAPVTPNGPLDAALLVQSLALAARDGGKDHAARRLSQGWARLRDRGLVTPKRGSSAPYSTQLDDDAFIAELCRQTDLSGRPVAAWRAISSPAGGDHHPAVPRRPARLALVPDS